MDLLLEEYRQLYSLALFRLNALDQRIPMAGATLTAFMAAAAVLPPNGQIVLLVLLPLSALWLLQSTIVHAQSFEDALRRIEWIEGEINRLAKASLLGFQSSHPSRAHAVGGRTGRAAIEAVAAGSAVLLTACLVLFQLIQDLPNAAGVGYALYVAALGAGLLHQLRSVPSYRYRPQPQQIPDS